MGSGSARRGSHLPDRNGTGEAAEEGTMIYTLFVVIAFVLLGVERLFTWWHVHEEARHHPSH